MEKLLLVAAGGAVGSLARYLTGAAAGRWTDLTWPWGTLTVNIVGSLLMGAVTGWLALRGGVEQERLRVLLAVGVLGGFTTFSAFTLETMLMLERREYASAVLYPLASVLLSVLALFAGLMLSRRLLGQ